MNQPLGRPNARVDVADVLRGLSVMGIIILHSVEHFNFYSFPEHLPFAWMKFTDTALWDGLFFTFSGKAYAVFALLFGFTFYIQDDNQRRRGKDFRLRFLWRLLGLLILGQINAAFFTGEILTMYALLGFVLPLCSRMSNRTVLIVAVVLLLQPVDIGRLVYGLLSPEHAPARDWGNYYFGLAYQVQAAGNFWETVRMNMGIGQLANFGWAYEHGRLTQTAGLFLLGMLVGRKEYFLYSNTHEQLWLKTLAIALIAFFPLLGLYNMLPDYIDNKVIATPLSQLLYAFKNLCFTAVLVCGALMWFYRSRRRHLLMRLAPYGKMSLTNYLWQSIMGSALFYHWGLELGRYMGITYSFFFGIAFVGLQWWFCTWWLKRFSHGPFEAIWRKWTWIKR
ncbi:MAG: DUF418 domain-containing protein [Mediterranea sp.]|jgi:uncharacterized protein|nr:DUF418 domain-containing protein [Mediterranea sp.]